MKNIPRILMAIDGSERSFAASGYLGKVLLKQVEIVLFHVMPEAPEAFRDVSRDPLTEKENYPLSIWKTHQKEIIHEFMTIACDILVNLELNKARRYETPISFLYLDIDNFKKINDNFGHHIGDRLLRSVAKTIENKIRAIDLIARFGGDEFGILLAETGSESAALVTKKLKEKLIELVQHKGWPVTFSTGVVTFEIIPDSDDEMIDAADAQMYLAKQNGKNRTRYKVITDDESIVPFIVNL